MNDNLINDTAKAFETGGFELVFVSLIMIIVGYFIYYKNKSDEKVMDRYERLSKEAKIERKEMMTDFKESLNKIIQENKDSNHMMTNNFQSSLKKNNEIFELSQEILKQNEIITRQNEIIIKDLITQK